MEKLENLIQQLAETIPQFALQNQSISQASVGWHIAHSLLVTDKIIDELVQSDPKDYQWKFNFVRMVVFTMKKIPRGKGKAPKAVQPENDYTENNLHTHVQMLLGKLHKLDNLQPKQFMRHPFFGKLHLKQTKLMLDIHTKHHLAIINDILIGAKK
jgi:hypothetical protein